MMLKIEEDAHQDGLFEITSLISVCSAAATALLDTALHSRHCPLKSNTAATMAGGLKTFWEDQRAGGLKRSKITIFF